MRAHLGGANKREKMTFVSHLSSHKIDKIPTKNSYNMFFLNQIVDTTAQAREALQNSDPPSKDGVEWVVDIPFDEMRKATGKAFAGKGEGTGEPMMEWAMKDVEWPAHEDRVGTATFMMSFDINSAFASKRVLTFGLKEKKEGGDVVATFLVREYDSRQQSQWYTKMGKSFRDFNLGAKLAMNGEIPEIYKSDDADTKKRANLMTKKCEAYYKQFPAWHKEHGPEGRHWYLLVVATDPDHQGHGYASEMMKKINELADGQQMDIYFETGSERLQKFYEKFGYEVVEKKVVSNPEDSNDTVDAILMVRKCKK